MWVSGQHITTCDQRWAASVARQNRDHRRHRTAAAFTADRDSVCIGAESRGGCRSPLNGGEAILDRGGKLCLRCEAVADGNDDAAGRHWR